MRRRVASVCACLLAACSSPPTGAVLVALPQVRVVAAPTARGAAVQLQVINRTESPLTLPAPACATSLEEFRRGQWFPVPRSDDACVGLDATLAVDDTLGFGVASYSARGGRFRALVSGTNAEGAFIVHSPAFEVP